MLVLSAELWRAQDLTAKRGIARAQIAHQDLDVLVTIAAQMGDARVSTASHSDVLAFIAHDVCFRAALVAGSARGHFVRSSHALEQTVRTVPAPGRNVSQIMMVVIRLRLPAVALNS